MSDIKVTIQVAIQVPKKGCMVDVGTICRWAREMKIYKKPEKEGDADFRWDYSCWLFSQPRADMETPCELCKQARAKAPVPTESEGIISGCARTQCVGKGCGETWYRCKMGKHSESFTTESEG